MRHRCDDCRRSRADPKFNLEVYIEFLTTQAKTLSFLAFVGKTYQVGKSIDHPKNFSREMTHRLGTIGIEQ
jgi:hypothetical protein